MKNKITRIELATTQQRNKLDWLWWVYREDGVNFYWLDADRARDLLISMYAKHGAPKTYIFHTGNCSMSWRFE